MLLPFKAFLLLVTFCSTACTEKRFKQTLISPDDTSRNGFIDVNTYQLIDSAVAVSPLKSLGSRTRIYVNYSIAFDQASLSQLNEENWRQVNFPETVRLDELLTETEQLETLKRITPSAKQKDYLTKLIRLQEQLQENACIQARLRSYYKAMKTFEPVLTGISLFGKDDLPDELFPPQEEYQRESLFMLHLIEEKLESAPYQIEFIDTRIPEDQPLTCQSIVYIHKNGLMNEFESTL